MTWLLAALRTKEEKILLGGHVQVVGGVSLKRPALHAGEPRGGGVASLQQRGAAKVRPPVRHGRGWAPL